MSAVVPIIQAVSLLTDLITAVNQMMQQTQLVAGTIQKAQSEGRSQLTADEWALINETDRVQKERLIAAIENYVA